MRRLEKKKSRWPKHIDFAIGILLGSVIIGLWGVKYGAGWVSFVTFIALIWERIGGIED